MTETFAVGDGVQVRGTMIAGRVVRVWDEKFRIGGIQQVVEFVDSDGRATAMRSAHLIRLEVQS